MIASIEARDALHIVLWVGREGFKAKAIAYCKMGNHNAADGTVQVPERVWREGLDWEAIGDDFKGKKLKPCLVCKTKAGF